MASVYHRTSTSNLINAIYTEGYRPGSGDMYGKGFYSTYDLKSQENPHMVDVYGNIVIKFAVPIENFFIFDFEEFIKAPIYRDLKKRSTEATFIDDQIKYYEIKEKQILEYPYDTRFSSKLAFYYYKYSNLIQKVKGIIFTGKHDGKVLICYQTNLIMPVSFRIEGEKDFQKVEKNKEYLRQILLRKTGAINREDELPKWLNKANISNEEISVNSLGEVTWEDGFWEDGFWEDGVWNDGIWNNGTWKDGTWENGLWKDGTWKDGTWKDGTWGGGIWENGVWINGSWKSGEWLNGTWDDGEWENGTWERGTWEDGFWEDGIWNGGTWERGTWYDGIWYAGIWENGVWINGSWKKGSWYEGIWKGGKWENGTWENGIWENGTWEKGDWGKGLWKEGTWKEGYWYAGIWKNGIWKEGTWYSGTWENGVWENGDWNKGIWENGTWFSGRIKNPLTGQYKFSKVSPNECEWSASYKKA